MLNIFKKVFSGSGKPQERDIPQAPTESAPPQAVESDQSIIELKRGNEHLANGDLRQAEACYRQAIEVNPDNADAYVNLGFVQKEQQQYEQAENALKQAILLNPASVDGHYLLGIAAQQQGKLNIAIESYQNVLALQPDFEVVYGDLCHTLFQSGKIDAAITIIKKALALNSQNPQFHFYQGNLFYHEGKLDQALGSYQRTLQLQPKFLHAYTNMGKLLLQMGDNAGALRAYEKALTIDPSPIYEEMLAGTPDACDAETLEIESCRLFVNAYYSNVSPDAYISMAKKYGQKLSSQAEPFTQWSVKPAGWGLGPLRVGIVSGDFNNHPVAFFLAGSIAHIDPDLIELIAYPSSSRVDKITAGLKPNFAEWSPIDGLSDAAAANKIHADGIHILVDLAGHTSHHRLSVFARKPAPIQVTWLGYLASTGVPGIDYLLADPVSAPESIHDLFSESIWHLPETVNCLACPQPNPKLNIKPTPALNNGYITFGSFQNLSKINDNVLKLWARILRAVPNARLRLQIKLMTADEERAFLMQRLSNAGISCEKVMVQGAIHFKEDYLATHNEVDIVLDTFPCPGITTTCEALWMGVPTVTLAGNTLLSRQGASLLSCAGLTDWIASTEKEYIELAVLHASDIQRLSRLRATLRTKVQASPLFDAPRFSIHLQNAFLNMWQLKAGKPPDIETSNIRKP